MTITEVDDFLARHPKVTTIELLLSDLNGVLRGKRIARDLLSKVAGQGFFLPGSVMSLDAKGATVEAAGLGMAVGDRDQLCKLIPGTLAVVPWVADGMRAQALCTMCAADGSGFFADPRHILLAAARRLQQLDLEVGFAVELEFYLLDPKRAADGTPQPPVGNNAEAANPSCQVYSIDDLNEHDAFIKDVVAQARAQSIPADTVVAEYAPGQFEVNLQHGNDIVRAVDHAVLLKRVIRNVARLHGMEATFMAKPYIEEAGSGMHLHLSLLRAGRNLLAADQPTENPLMRQLVAGILSMADSTQALLAPNLNSYRRFAAAAFAPTAKTWGQDNRTVMLRIPSGSAESTRIEHRLAGADANPYLTATALIAGVCEGLDAKMNPPDPVIGDAYQQQHPQVADNQRDALRAMAADARVNDWFGADFVKLYQACKWHDLVLLEQQITPLEYDLLLRYV